MPVAFEDINTFDGRNTVYPVVNESVTTWRKALKLVKGVETAASICSGGEIAFFCILPVVKKKLELLDHSYESMSYAIGKHRLIEALGTVKAYKALTSNDQKTLQDAFFKGNKGLPTEIPEPSKAEQKWREEYAEYQKAYAEWNARYAEESKRLQKELDINLNSYNSSYGYASEYYRRLDSWALDNPPPQQQRRPSSLTLGRGFRLGDVSQIYEEIGQAALAELRKNRHKLVFCHGDLTDLYDRGPYDLVYLSNALQYGGRNGRTYDVTKMVKPGGYVCFTGSASYVKGCQEVFKQTYYDDLGFPKRTGSTGYGMHWDYHIVRTPT